MLNLTRAIDRLMKDGRYTVWTLPSKDYTEDVVEHWVRYHWPHLETVYFNGPRGDFESDLFLIYLDLTQAIEELPLHERTVIRLLTEG